MRPDKFAKPIAASRKSKKTHALADAVLYFGQGARWTNVAWHGVPSHKRNSATKLF